MSLAAAADVVLAVSEGEKRLLETYGTRSVHLVGYGTDTRPGPDRFEARAGLLFVGRLTDDASPNVDGLIWLHREVWPIAMRAFDPVDNKPRLQVVGINTAPALATLSDTGWDISGAVRDLGPIYDQRRVFVAPTRFGAGIPIKVLEAAAHGVPIVGTSLLAEQLGWQPGRDMLATAADNAEAFAANIVRAYTDEAIWHTLRTNALARIGAQYSRERFLRQLTGALDTSSE
jgi:glycosyltransferase involved in cell wall biosynthesis